MSKEAEIFLYNKGVKNKDLKTLRLTSRVEDGTLAEWMQSYADQYHKAQLEKMMPSDEEILKHSRKETKEIGAIVTVAYTSGAKWLKQKLLNK